MAKIIDIDKVGLVEIHNGDLILEVSEDEQGRLLARVESDEGGRRIIIKQHEEDARTIVFAVERPGPHLSLVKE